MKKSQRKNAFLIMLILIFNWSSITKKTSWIIEINSSGHQLLISEEAQNSKTIAYPSSFTNKENSLRLNLRSSPSSSAPWADVRFSYRKSIRLFSSKVVENLTSFPVLIDIHDSDLKEVDQANGNDILFTDCLGNKLAHEIEKFDRDFNSSHAHLVAWVKTNLSCVEDTPIMLYYGNPSVSNQEESEWVWDNNYIGVWHLSEKSGIHYDSTGNHVDGSPQSFDNDEAVEGKINGADELDGINDYIDIYKNPDEIGLEGKGSITISMWIYTNGFNGGGILEFGDPEVSMAYYSLGTLSQPNVWRANWGGTKYDEFTYKSLNRWVNFVITYQNDAISNQNANDSDDSIQNLEIYGNSQLLMNKKLILNIQNGSTLKFGKWEKNTFNGSIDEMRVSRVARSAAWIQTEFNNQNDPTSFYSTGPQEVDTNPPQINEFGVNDNGKGNIIFYANVTDELTQVKNVSIKINGSEYYMKQNDSDLWIYQYPWANFGDFIEYRVANASDAHGNWITTKAIKFIKLSKDTTTPDILQWEYYYDTNTFKANVRDIWGKIDKVILNVTSHNLMATMVHCTINTDNIATYINDTLKIPNGPIEFQIIVNDTSGNVYVSPPHSGFVSLNHAPFVENITFSPFNVFSNSTLELSYDYYDEDNHSELGTEIRWFKNDGTGFILQTKYNDETKIPSSALVRNDQWYVTIKPKDGTIYGELVNSSDTSGLISILNTPPEVTIYEDKHPEFILEDQDIILEDSYFDFLDWDGDQDQSIIYWFKNGTLQPEYTNQTYIPADTTQPGETWYYIIQSYDGLDYGAYETSSIIVIESKPRINGYNIISINDIEGHYYLEINTTDLRNEIKYIQYGIIYQFTQLQPTKIVTSPKDGVEDIWVLEFYLTNYSYLNRELIVEIQVATELAGYSQNVTIISAFSFTFIAEDTAPPRVKNAFYVLNDEINPTSMTFYAQIEEFGTGIDEIMLFYYFEEIKGNGGMGSFMEEDVQWLKTKMEFYHQSGYLVIYSVKIPISQNGTNWKVIYYVSTTDKNGNMDEEAFLVNPQQAERDIIHYHPLIGASSSQILLNLLMLIVPLVIISAVGIMIYSKLNSKPELIGFNKDLVMANIHQVSNFELAAALNTHTVGIIISTFDENMGPTPLYVTPPSFRQDSDVLFKIAFRSFSNCEFVSDLKDINQAIYNFSHSEKTLIKVLAHSFALDRPQHRGGQENITLSILIYPAYFSIVNQFSDNIIGQIKAIQRILDTNPEDKRRVKLKIDDLRKFISKIILSYLSIY